MNGGLPDYSHALLIGNDATITNATQTDLSFGPVPTGKTWLISRVAAREDTNAPTRIRIVVKGRGAEIQLRDWASPTAGLVYTDDAPFHIPEGCTLTVQFIGGTSTNVIGAYLVGVETK